MRPSIGEGKMTENFLKNTETAVHVEISDAEIFEILEKCTNDLLREFSASGNYQLPYGTLPESVADASDPNALESFLKDIEKRNIGAKQKAALRLLQGLNAKDEGQTDSAISFFKESLDEQKRSGGSEIQGLLLHALARSHEQKGELEQAKLYFLSCIDSLGKHQQLVAKFTCELCRILRKLENWDILEAVGNKSLSLNQTCGNIIECAAIYGFMADTALHKQQWAASAQAAQRALQTLDKIKIEVCEDALLSATARDNTRLTLAKALLGQNQPEQAVDILELARTEGNFSLNPKLYAEILELLRSLYLEQEEYLIAFRAKQEKISLEYRFGFRAFIGAGELQARSNLPENSLPCRERELHCLLEKIDRDDCKLIVIHGPPGAGKSSLVYAGLEPALRQKRIGSRRVLPLIMSDTAITQEADIFDELHKNTIQNFLTILIFDQFERFFFVNPELDKRKAFCTFLSECLCKPFVKVIMSMRESYLHHLLEFGRMADLQGIGEDILSKDIRCYVGNFKNSEAESVIESLSHGVYQQDMIEKIVQDTARASGEISPLELQVFCSHLEALKINELSAYNEAKLTEAVLHEVIRDCGKKNETAAYMILYHLTDERDIRPFKTRSELLNLLKNLDIETEEKEFNAILEILTGSGILLCFPEHPSERYRILNERFAVFIREGKAKEILLGLEARKKEKLIGILLVESAEYQAKLAEFKKLIENCLSFFLSNDDLGALLAGLKAGRLSKQIKLSEDLKHEMTAVLRKVVYGVREINRLQGHQLGIRSLCFSPDGRRIASGSDDRTIRLWSGADGRELGVLKGHAASVYALSFHPDGDTLISGGGDKTVRLWRLSERKEIRALQMRSGAIYSLSFHPEGKIFASGGEDRRIRLWDAETGRKIRTLKKHPGSVYCVRFSRDGSILASGSSDPVIRLWRTEDKKNFRTFKGHTGDVFTLVFSPDGKVLASGSFDNTIKLWNLEDGTEIRTLEGHSAPVGSLAFTPDGKILASGSFDNTVKLWNAADGFEINTLQGHSGAVFGVDFHPDGELLASGGSDAAIRLWNMNRCAAVKVLKGHSNQVYSVVFSPDSKTLASGSFDSSICLWDADKKYLLRKLEGHSSYIFSLGFSHDGKVLASGSFDSTVRLWDPESGQEVGRLEGHSGPVFDIAFHPQSRLLASGGEDRIIRVWDTDVGEVIRVMKGHSNSVLSLSFSHSGKFLASGSSDRSIRLWRLEDGKQMKLLRSHSGSVFCLSFSPDGRLLASGTSKGAVILWDAQKGKKIKILKGHTGSILGISFSSEGLLASVGDDCTVRLWNVNEDKPVNVIEDHTDYVLGVHFSPDSRLMASSSFDSTIRLWNVAELCNSAAEDLLRLGREWLREYLTTNPNMSDEERELGEDVRQPMSVMSPMKKTY